MFLPTCHTHTHCSGHTATNRRSVLRGVFPTAVKRKILRSNTDQAPTHTDSYVCCVGGQAVHVSVVSSFWKWFHLCWGLDTSSAYCFFCFFCLHEFTHCTCMGHAKRIVGLPASQYTNICFPLCVLNYVFPHLLLAYSQRHCLTNV